MEKEKTETFLSVQPLKGSVSYHGTAKTIEEMEDAIPVKVEEPKSSSQAFKVTLEFERAFDLLENTRRNVFLTGKAGTGKSTFLDHFRGHTRKKIAVVAPTGVAALNVYGQTIHSLFRLAPKFVDPKEIKPDRRPLFRELELLIIDEISMVRADVFNGIDLFMRLSRKNDRPFGGVQLCVIGDLFQLPPIVSPEEKSFFAQYYQSPFFFGTKAYINADFELVEFSSIHRQNDPAFIQVLNAIRSGICNNAQLELLNSRVNPKVVAAPGTLVLTTTNALAEDINSARLALLSARTRQYEGVLKGDFGMKGPRLPAPQQLVLKVGAQVMFVRNDSEKRWVNGSIGIVKWLDSDTITVKTETGVWEVEREKWKTIGYEFDERQDKIVEKALGSYTQFPLMLAWAITIHKSQGKTFERVIIDLGTGAFAPGQLYVALSRCKSLAGIALKHPINFNDIHCNDEVITFMTKSSKHTIC
jgi:hypothetical protein